MNDVSDATMHPTLYAELRQPYASDEEAGRAFDAFDADVQAARVKHRIADVIVIGAAASSTEGRPTAIINVRHHGNSLMAPLMLEAALQGERDYHAQRLVELNQMLAETHGQVKGIIDSARNAVRRFDESAGV